MLDKFVLTKYQYAKWSIEEYGSIKEQWL